MFAMLAIFAILAILATFTMLTMLATLAVSSAGVTSTSSKPVSSKLSASTASATCSRDMAPPFSGQAAQAWAARLTAIGALGRNDAHDPTCHREMIAALRGCATRIRVRRGEQAPHHAFALSSWGARLDRGLRDELQVRVLEGGPGDVDRAAALAHPVQQEARGRGRLPGLHADR